ncbi:MAG: TRAP transporter large permease subunit [Desulfomicrobium sp.]|uniref:TRAP transporter large permease subunit n=1 Tax=Hoeflea sp. TaxID=1940281 RepID=UPI0025BC45F7|nr:TRAP transporter large permease subunit [Hoeflea sp.]MBU4527120.1 TRAP transporter large permease subunit [Alphaproteobacteria bacterium]MBV1712039.1 TRAP transporter large permease subunit [Desulfomicrobium sp.]MBU4544983.1 TRAP transporter large permease subunit [Alphaproteobacteria bacterium]MBU4549395.1 TRAP transporter large permease subunit [Alphaproteobacteria bacterium]MBV1786293.1 TRAP transporter large permease subunit [Hoeflea sp.]
MTLALFLSVLLGSILLGLPVAFALLLAAIALMLQMDLFSADILAQALINGVDSFPLLAIPFFLVAGEVMSKGGLSKRIVRMAMALMGHRKGGLGYVAILTAVLLAGLSGSAVADAAALVSILYPMMRKAGYPEGRSVGLLAAGGIIAPVIPPSLPLILVGVAGNISIKNLFLGGIVPGLIMGTALMLVWAFLMRSENVESFPKADKAERLAAFRDGIWALLLPVIIIGGIRFGVFTPTEAAVVAAVYALFVTTFIYREITIEILFDILVNAGRATAMVMFLVGCAMVAAWLITVAQLPQQLATLLGPLVENPRLLMAAIMILVLLVGMVMDLSPTILILVPLLMPVVKLAGIDPVYFGLMFVINCSIGLITPPVGTVLNVVCGVGRVPMSAAVRGSWPFIAAYLVLLVLFVVFPDIIITPMKLFIG